MIEVAVLGYGVVGSGVVEILTKNKDSISKKAGDIINLKYVIDIRDLDVDIKGVTFTKNSEEVFEDSSVKIFIETIGGIRAAYELTKKALLSGRSVVTSNKELVATYGPELLKIAKDKGVFYLFEASVGGGIPIIKPLYECLAANEITSIAGILNGTTNYILTAMLNQGENFEDALKEAQAKGYAEADSSDDIEGKDSCRKLAILSSIAYGHYVDFNQISTKGIAEISYDDLKLAELMNSKIKLVAYSGINEGKIFAQVAPVIMDKSHALANVDDVFNAIFVSGDSIGDVMFYGRGAGRLPTASAVVGDVIDIVKSIDRGNERIWAISANNIMIDSGESESNYVIRVKIRSKEEAIKFIETLFGKVKIEEFENFENQLIVTTNKEKEKNIDDKIGQMNSIASISKVMSAIRSFE